MVSAHAEFSIVVQRFSRAVFLEKGPKMSLFYSGKQGMWW
jgi:hypothetical protein